MQTLTQIKELLTAAGLAPRKSLGQNFLIDKNLLTRLIDASGVQPGDLVLEVGPGTGTLTEELLARGCRVVACELDRGLAHMLRSRVPGLPGGERFRLVEGDCLGPGRTVSPEVLAALGDEPFRLVANLPYSAATPLMLALLMHHPRCHTMAVTIQREVADRLIAGHDTEAYGTLGIVAQCVANIERIADLPKECFWPRPDVTSAMVLIRRLSKPRCHDPAALARLCQELFGHRRKQLGSTLGRTHPLPPGVRPDQRPENLTVDQLAALLDLHMEYVRASESSRNSAVQ